MEYWLRLVQAGYELTELETYVGTKQLIAFIFVVSFC